MIGIIKIFIGVALIAVPAMFEITNSNAFVEIFRAVAFAGCGAIVIGLGILDMIDPVGKEKQSGN